MLSALSAFIPSWPSLTTEKRKEAPIAEEYKALWDKWWSSPDRATGTTLSDFIKDPHNHKVFREIAEGVKPPFPGDTFEKDYDQAVKSLKLWLDNGCQPSQTTPVSEFIDNLYQWIDKTMSTRTTRVDS